MGKKVGGRSEQLQPSSKGITKNNTENETIYRRSPNELGRSLNFAKKAQQNRYSFPFCYSVRTPL